MKNFAVKQPIVFEVILLVVSFILSIIFIAIFQTLYFSLETTTAIARIAVGILLFIVFLYCFKLKKQFSSFPIILPALLFVVWNIANHFMSNGTLNSFDEFMFIEAAAPAILEEVLFREIFIYHLKENGQKPLMVTLISAAFFAIVHLTNAVGANLLQTLVQVGYSFVVGLVFGAIYTRSDDLFSLMIVHGAIDLSNRIFSAGSTTPYYVFVPFILLLVFETYYAIRLVSKENN